MTKIQITAPLEDAPLIEAFARVYNADPHIETDAQTNHTSVFFEMDASSVQPKMRHFQKPQFEKLGDNQRIAHSFAKFMHDARGFDDKHPSISSYELLSHKQQFMLVVGMDENHGLGSGTYLDCTEHKGGLRIKISDEIFDVHDDAIPEDSPLRQLKL